MRAILQTALHQPAQLVEVEKPTAGPGEVILALRSAALNHRDVYIQQGLYPKLSCLLFWARMALVQWWK